MLEVAIEERPAVPAAVVDVITPYREIMTAFEKGFTQVVGFLAEEGLSPSGPGFAIYLDVEDNEAWKIRMGFPVIGPFQGRGDVFAAELPGGKVAATTHVGPYQSLHETWSAFETYLQENDLGGGGAAWENYLVEDSTESDPEQWGTELVWPIE